MLGYAFVEHREYTMRPGDRARFWQNYKNVGLPIQIKYLPNPIGFYFVDIGAPYTFVHMWGYDSLGHREACRNRLHMDEGWTQYVTSAHAYIQDINLRILRQQEFGSDLG